MLNQICRKYLPLLLGNHESKWHVVKGPLKELCYVWVFLRKMILCHISIPHTSSLWRSVMVANLQLLPFFPIPRDSRSQPLTLKSSQDSLGAACCLAARSEFISFMKGKGAIRMRDSHG